MGIFLFCFKLLLAQSGGAEFDLCDWLFLGGRGLGWLKRNMNEIHVDGDGAMQLKMFIIIGLLAASGCARIQFVGAPSDDALTYYEPVPYLLIQQDSKCEKVARVVSFPGRKRGLKLNSGYGSADLSVKMTADGIITDLGQKTDTKVPETIEAVTGLAKLAVAAKAGATETPCTTRATLFPIVDGRVNTKSPVPIAF
ncbi:hypothetical protein RFM99_26395 [Mesorhizobium sp. VK4C]|uniref:hypothetical protein n=1 Tax=Mesorhizobium captivum TaxID=3072319 RepID=UPI002A24CEF8|nr:hypothetical protein [Mesorhizobium sp. VK4C]MDX8501930.1 hypothetical protein [Mesorhizobium sp. VK4C]